MQNTIGLKELCQNVSKYTKKVQSDDDEYWEEVVDFTKIKRGGVDIDDLLSRL